MFLSLQIGLARPWAHVVRAGLFLVLALQALLAAAQPAYTIAYNESTAYMLPLIKAIYTELGIAPVFVQVPQERGLVGTEKGLYDADVARVADALAAYPDLRYSTEPLVVMQLLPFVKKGSGLQISKAEALRSYRVGIVRGAKLAEGFAAAASITPALANNGTSLCRMLDAQRFDVALLTSLQVALLSELLSAVAEPAGPSLLSKASLHVLNKRNADLIPRFDAVVRTMRADGRLAALLPFK